MASLTRASVVMGGAAGPGPVNLAAPRCDSPASQRQSPPSLSGTTGSSMFSATWPLASYLLLGLIVAGGFGVGVLALVLGLFRGLDSLGSLVRGFGFCRCRVLGLLGGRGRLGRCARAGPARPS